MFDIFADWPKNAIDFVDPAPFPHVLALSLVHMYFCRPLTKLRPVNTNSNYPVKYSIILQ